MSRIILFLLSFIYPCALAAETLNVGAIVPLSGIVADFGVAVQNGITLAKEEYKADVSFKYEDSKYDSKQSVSAFNKLTQSDKVKIVYVWGTTPSVVVAPIAERSQIAVVALSGDLSVVDGSQYAIDFSGKLERLSKATLEALRSRGFSKFGIVKSEMQYLESLVSGMKKYMDENESILVLESLSPSDQTNFASVMTKIKRAQSNKEIDSIGVMLGTGQLSSFYQKMEQHKVVVPTFGSDFFGQVDEMRKAGAAALGALYATGYVDESFIKKYRQRFGNDFHVSHAANAYDFAKLLLSVFKEGDSGYSSKEIVNKLLKRGETSGAGGHCFFYKDPSSIIEVNSSGRNLNCPIIIKQISEDGLSVDVSSM